MSGGPAAINMDTGELENIPANLTGYNNKKYLGPLDQISLYYIGKPRASLASPEPSAAAPQTLR